MSANLSIGILLSSLHLPMKGSASGCDLEKYCAIDRLVAGVQKTIVGRTAQGVICVAGWPSGTPFQSPYSMKVSDQKAVESALRQGSISFRCLNDVDPLQAT
jgi:hypothetical protein